MRAGMIGLGKLGLLAAEAMAAEHDVMGTDIRPVHTTAVKQGSLAQTVAHSDIIFIAVQTPHDPAYDGSAPTSHLPNRDFDYSMVMQVLDDIAACDTTGKTVVLISTVLPGTTRRLLAQRLPGCELIYNPYLIAMGTVIQDMISPEMVMIGNSHGTVDSHVARLMDFYRPLMQNNPRMVTGTWEEIESTKIFYNCYSHDTEVLTDHGWKLFPDVQCTDTVLSLDPQTQIPQWVKPLSIVGRPHSGNMIHFTSSQDDVLVTEAHNMYVGRVTTKARIRTHSWELMPASAVITRSYYAFTRSTQWHDDSPAAVDLGCMQLPTELYVRLMGWYLTQGCVRDAHIITSQDQHHNAQQQAQIRAMLTEIQLLTDQGHVVDHSPWGCGLRHQGLAEYLTQFGSGPDQRVPHDIKRLGAPMIRAFLDCLHSAEGSVMSAASSAHGHSHSGQSRPRHWVTASHRMAADLGELIIKVGRFPSYGRVVSDTSHHDCHVVYETSQKTSRFRRSSAHGLKHRVIVNYAGQIYCAVLPKNHVFLTRRNGKCTWQGNTFISAKLSLVNMIQDVAQRVGHMNADVVADALAHSTHRIMGPAYMKPGMGDGGPCHPRDNIALRWLAQHLDLGYDLFDSIVRARELQAQHLAQALTEPALPVVILGRSFKPGVPYCDGSYGLLVGHYCQCQGAVVSYDVILPEPAAYLLGHHIDHSDAVKHMAQGSVVVDPWRSTAVPSGIALIRWGNSRPM